MTIKKIKEVAYNLIESNQEDYSIKDDKEKLLYILAFNDGVNALTRELGIMMANEENEKDTKTEEQKS